MLFPFLLLLLPLAPAGCCTPAHRLDDMRAKNLRTPYNTIDYFRYAVRLDAWDDVYDILSPASKDWIDREFGRFAFETFVGGLKYRRLDKDAPPEVADLPVVELLHRSEILAVRPDDTEPEYLWRVQLYYKPIPPAKTSFPLVNTAAPGKPARWTVGLYEWLEGK